MANSLLYVWYLAILLPVLLFMGWLVIIACLALLELGGRIAERTQTALLVAAYFTATTLMVMLLTWQLLGEDGLTRLGPFREAALTTAYWVGPTAFAGLCLAFGRQRRWRPVWQMTLATLVWGVLVYIIGDMAHRIVWLGSGGG